MNKSRQDFNLRDKLSQLTPVQAVKLLHPQGEPLLRRGGAIDVAIEHQVSLSAREFRLSLDDATVTLRLAKTKKLANTRRSSLAPTCSCGGLPCVHLAAALALILEENLVASSSSGKSYRVALRGWQLGESYCSCPDFRKNTLGTCKHIPHTLAKAEKRFVCKPKTMEAWH